MIKRTSILFLFVLLKFILQYNLISPYYDLNPDAYLYLDQGEHLAWGYISVPPFISWISCIILHLGHSDTLVRFFPTLFGALTIVMVWQTVKELRGGLYAHILAAIATLLSIILLQDLLYTPNSFDVLCWITLYYVIIKYINTKDDKWFFIGAIVFVFGFLNKYTVIFWLLGMIPALAISKQRGIFRRQNFYYAILLIVLLISPNIIWQIKNDYPVFWHLTALEKNYLIKNTRGYFFENQISFFYASNFIILAAFISFFKDNRFKEYQLFFWSYIFVFFILFYFHGREYYALPLYPIMIVFGSVFLEKCFYKSKWKRYLQIFSILIIVLSFIPTVYLCFPIKAFEKGKSATLPSVFKYIEPLKWRGGLYGNGKGPPWATTMTGYKELAVKVDRIYDTLQDKANTIVFCDYYGQAGAINYYSKNKGIRVFSLMADYINWLKLDTGQIKNVISVITLQHYKNILNFHDKDIKPPFKSVQILEQINSPYSFEYGTRICLLQKPTISINNFIKESIKNKKESLKGKGGEVVDDIENAWRE